MVKPANLTMFYSEHDTVRPEKIWFLTNLIDFGQFCSNFRITKKMIKKVKFYCRNFYSNESWILKKYIDSQIS